jgi:hypothetical protein
MIEETPAGYSSKYIFEVDGRKLFRLTTDRGGDAN